MIVAVELARDGDRAAALPLAGAARPARLPARTRARGAAAADRQRHLLHAAVRDHAGGDRPLVATARDRHRGRDMRLTRVYVAEPLAAGGRGDAAGGGRRPRRARAAPAPRRAAGAVRRLGRRLPRRDRRGRGRSACARASASASTGCASRRSRVTLVQAVSRGERMDWTLQKATELGVRRIQPVLSARSVVRLDERQARAPAAALAGRRGERLRAVRPQRAAAQSRRRSTWRATSTGRAARSSGWCWRPTATASLGGLASTAARASSC